MEPGEKGPLYPVVRVVYDTNRNRFINAHDIDLSNPITRSGDDRIVGAESPERWNIKVDVVMKSAL